MAAEGMDDASIHTIDAWCQRMLREHAFDSASLFEEELVADEEALPAQAAGLLPRATVSPFNAAGAGAGDLPSVERSWPMCRRCWEKCSRRPRWAQLGPDFGAGAP